ncbi:MAG: hypothetical protein ACHQD8_02610, partial [Chitinophagales bacterium]
VKKYYCYKSSDGAIKVINSTSIAINSVKNRNKYVENILGMCLDAGSTPTGSIALNKGFQ